MKSSALCRGEKAKPELTLYTISIGNVVLCNIWMQASMVRFRDLNFVGLHKDFPKLDGEFLYQHWFSNDSVDSDMRTFFLYIFYGTRGHDDDQWPTTTSEFPDSHCKPRIHLTRASEAPKRQSGKEMRPARWN
ncbi:hypothetical protein V6N13_070052 [Hibiscus sabdariffa]|uniref:Uncharacterized protein n=1 Tax=Hibiscus sabdariffa TaxID=183260 RepID=A0ABR2BL68_9ROSI